LVVLAHLQRRCHLRGGEVWRLPLPLAELARQDSAKKQRRTEVSGVTGRWIGRGHGMTGHVRAVAAAVRRGSLGFCTSVSGHSRDRRVRSGARGTANAKGRSDMVARLVTIDRTRPAVRGCLLNSNWTPAVTRLVNFSSVSS
jgi:hypothetical protein